MAVPFITDYKARLSSTEPSPIVSVVTTVRNAERTLHRTIESVATQNILQMEYLIVDAGSTDKTLEIVHSNRDIVTFWQSEPDRGISDGFNKGVALTRGKYVLLLNADDWLSPDQLAFGLETLEKTGADFVFGDLAYHQEDGTELYRIRGEAKYQKRLPHIMPGLNHPTVIVRRDVYERFGLFDLNLRFAMDYEFLLRIHRAKCQGVYDPRMIGHMSLDGASDRNTREALREVRSISIRHGYPTALAWVRYSQRILKWQGRLAAASLPAPAYTLLRQLFNRNYVSSP